MLRTEDRSTNPFIECAAEHSRQIETRAATRFTICQCVDSLSPRQIRKPGESPKAKRPGKLVIKSEQDSAMFGMPEVQKVFNFLSEKVTA
jgi:hypothetical protein